MVTLNYLWRTPGDNLWPPVTTPQLLTPTTTQAHHHPMPRGKTAKKTTPAKSSTLCGHCGQTATLDNAGNVKPHDYGPLDNPCPGTGHPPLAH